MVATAFGVAASLGVGALQINNGLNTVFGLQVSEASQIGIIVLATVMFLGSAVSGVTRGVKILSNANMSLAALLALAVFILGPDRGDHRHPHQHAGQLRHRIRPHESARDAVPRQHLGRQLDHLLLGLVDFLVAIRGPVHCPRVAWPHDP